ncbi:hypothetical protein MuYL_0502 [Mucilaginibacter xinganensis]|uniref:Uncharacterized protein n=1 Tax=Mucilaginibacter xinganensis TaxID=1234841 RepID=A0A223NR71_9SPHI|nr:hypothetical protein MuYL_0502 [Mucilaginibacter xinganensis]
MTQRFLQRCMRVVIISSPRVLCFAIAIEGKDLQDKTGKFYLIFF